MATVGSKNQPIVQTTDSFNPVNDINTLSNWVANNYASTKILTGSTLHTAVTGSDLFAGLLTYETSTGQYWRYDGSAWYLEGIGANPRIELTNTAGSGGYFLNATNTTLGTWTITGNRGGMSVSGGVVTVPYAGRYNITLIFGIGSQATATGTRIARVVSSSGAVYLNSTAPANAQVSYMGVAINGVTLSASSTLTPQGYHTAGATLDWVASASTPSKFIVEYVGA